MKGRSDGQLKVIHYLVSGVYYSPQKFDLALIQ